MTKKIPIEDSDLYALVDDEDYPDVIQYKWYLSAPNGKGNRYVSAEKNWSGIKLHRQVMGFPEYALLFVNGDTLDCRKSNLTPKSKSGKKGISWLKKRKRWCVKANDGRYVGVFSRKREAILAQRRANEQLASQELTLSEEIKHEARRITMRFHDILRDTKL